MDWLIVSALSIIGLVSQSPSHFPEHLNQTLYRNNKTTEREEKWKEGTHFFLFLSPWVQWLMCCVSWVFPPCLSPSISLFLSCSRFPRWRSHQTSFLRQVDRFHFASITEATWESFCFKGLWLCNQPFAGMLWVIREQLYAEKDWASVCVCVWVRPSVCLSVRDLACFTRGRSDVSQPWSIYSWPPEAWNVTFDLSHTHDPLTKQLTDWKTGPSGMMLTVKENGFTDPTWLLYQVVDLVPIIGSLPVTCLLFLFVVVDSAYLYWSIATVGLFTG